MTGVRAGPAKVPKPAVAIVDVWMRGSYDHRSYRLGVICIQSDHKVAGDLVNDLIAQLGRPSGLGFNGGQQRRPLRLGGSGVLSPLLR